MKLAARAKGDDPVPRTYQNNTNLLKSSLVVPGLVPGIHVFL
jgi:hypothetical protein